jgi:cytochrome c5
MKWIAGSFVAVAAMSVASLAVAADGKAVYESTCVVCHGTGAVGAPKFGDKAAWAPRIATGKKALLASALNGKNAMPPKGGNSNLTPEDVSAAIDYMISAAK